MPVPSTLTGPPALCRQDTACRVGGHRPVASCWVIRVFGLIAPGLPVTGCGRGRGVTVPPSLRGYLALVREGLCGVRWAGPVLGGTTMENVSPVPSCRSLRLARVAGRVNAAVAPTVATVVRALCQCGGSGRDCGAGAAAQDSRRHERSCCEGDTRCQRGHAARAPRGGHRPPKPTPPGLRRRRHHHSTLAMHGRPMRTTTQDTTARRSAGRCGRGEVGPHAALPSFGC